MTRELAKELANCDFYEGDWKDDKRTGKGIYKRANCKLMKNTKFSI